MWQHRSSPLREARPGPGGSARAHLGREVRFGAKEHVTAPEPSSRGGKVQSHGTRGSAKAHLGREVRSGAVGHMVASKPTDVGRCGPKLQLAWQHVDARPAPCLDLELVCGGIRSSGCRHQILLAYV
jgi:hypothetical protein